MAAFQIDLLRVQLATLGLGEPTVEDDGKRGHESSKRKVDGDQTLGTSSGYVPEANDGVDRLSLLPFDLKSNIVNRLTIQERIALSEVNAVNVVELC